ncbi:MAG: NAD(P)-dependent oxidoreductase [Mangrovibacterium sp.]
MKIGVLRETQHLSDRRVAITPETAGRIRTTYPQVEVLVQPSPVRIHTDDQYRAIGIPVVEDLSGCDVLIGVKEVAPETLLEGKTYITFAHVAKQQDYNQPLLAAMSQKRITLVDHEYFTDKQNNRLAAFGFWAGVVGSYYAFQGIARRFQHTDIPAPERCIDLTDLQHQVQKLTLPSLKLLVTGGGRVAAGALEIIRAAGIREVSPESFLSTKFEQAVYCRIGPENYVAKTDGSFNQNEFYANPTEYQSTFAPFLKATDVFIPCHFWDSRSPAFFTREQLASPEFRISLIADISCDLNGPIPTSIRASSIDSPYYDIEPATMNEKPPFSGSRHVTVMAVDNLPSALPLDASRSFARDMFEKVFPALFTADSDGIIERATILKDGKLTADYGYLTDFLNGGLRQLSAID